MEQENKTPVKPEDCKHPVWGYDYATDLYFCVDCGFEAKHPSDSFNESKL